MSKYVVIPPAGFDWDVPITVFYDDVVKTYSTDFNKFDWMIDATSDIYVSTTGDDTTGDGSSGNPYRTISKAFTVAEAGADVGYNIYVEAGEYEYQQGFKNTSCDRDCNIIATGGRVVMNNAWPLTSWTAQGSGTYTATRSSISQVYDRAFTETMPDGTEIPRRLTQVADLTACQALAGSWYISGTTVGVHTLDGREPDAGSGGQVKCLLDSPHMQMADSRKYYIEGFDLEGGTTSSFEVQAGTGVHVPQVCIYDCTAIYQASPLSKSFNLQSVDRAAYVNCKSFRSAGDGFSHGAFDGTSPGTRLLEINCVAHYCGEAATHTSIQNGSTGHLDCRAIRVNCTYSNSYGPVIGCISDSESWNLNCSASNCLLEDASAQDVLISQYGGTGTKWLADCNLSGIAANDLYADANCAIYWYHSNTQLASLSTTGTGTIAEYTQVLTMNTISSWRGAVEPAESGASGNEVQLWRGAVEPAAPAASSSADALIGGVTRSLTRSLTRNVTEDWDWGA